MKTSAPPRPVYHFPKAGPVPNRIDALFSQLLEAAAMPRENARSSPAGIDFETKAIFHKEWISLAHVSQAPYPGDYLRVDLCVEPMLVTRGKDDVVRVLSRVCRHRGMDLMPEGGSLPDQGNQRYLANKIREFA
jgi:hypothetical protein